MPKTDTLMLELSAAEYAVLSYAVQHLYHSRERLNLLWYGQGWDGPGEGGLVARLAAGVDHEAELDVVMDTLNELAGRLPLPAPWQSFASAGKRG